MIVTARHCRNVYLVFKTLLYLQFKANMNSDILLQTTDIFPCNLYLKQSIGWVLVMVWFNLHWLTRAVRKASRATITKRKKNCPLWDLNLVPFAYEANALTIAQRDLVSIELLKLTMFYLCHLDVPVARRCRKMICLCHILCVFFCCLTN